MEAMLLSVHVVAAILFVGPVAVTASLFPRLVPLTATPDDTGGRSRASAQVLHRVTRVYGRLALVVPVVGLVLAAVQGRTSEIWVVVAMVLTAVAGALLVLQIAPLQREVLDVPDVSGRQLRRMRMIVGVFNLVWVAVVVLMIVRPGSEVTA